MRVTFIELTRNSFWSRQTENIPSKHPPGGLELIRSPIQLQLVSALLNYGRQGERCASSKVVTLTRTLNMNNCRRITWTVEFFSTKVTNQSQGIISILLESAIRMFPSISLIYISTIRFGLNFTRANGERHRKYVVQLLNRPSI